MAKRLPLAREGNGNLRGGAKDKES
jgi:hypothetical protein